ncbi:MAG TPA: glycine cleavage T C-terminal barrel domain-containing protein [Verrucomicrobiae bacterium]|nr:glycine cleavage T C-terminal barrel domain-containing protein [Verrucomicrobiae bacterium]
MHRDYGDTLAEYKAMRESAGVLDLGLRSRICVVGNDRVRFLHGQITNDVKKLRVGEGCYAAIVTAKGRMETDVTVFNLPDELLLDFEPGLTEKISGRLEKFIVADDVQIVDAAPHYGLVSVQGPKSGEVIRRLVFPPEIPNKPFASVKISDPALGEIYLANNPRCGSIGFDLFIPNQSLATGTDQLIAAAKQFGGRAAGWAAFEIVRIEKGIPRFGVDMDDTNLPLECGIEGRAVSYDKGCYLGQEVINRIHSIGHVNKELRGLRLGDDLKSLPARGDKLFHNGKEAGYVTSAVRSPALNGNVALGYVRREANRIGARLNLPSGPGESAAEIVELPFVK